MDPNRNKYLLTPVFTAAISLLVMIGWVIDYKPLLSIIPNAPTMKMNTAVLFLLSAVASIIFIKKKEHNTSYFKTPLFIILFLIVAIASISLLEDVFRFDLGINELLIKDSYSVVNNGRMSSSTAICFGLFGVSLFILNAKKRKWISVANYLLSSISLIATLAILTYFLQSIANSSVLIFGSMAIHTASLFFILSITISSLYPQLNFTSLFSGSYQGSQLIRKLLPVIISSILILNYLMLYFINIDLISLEIGVAFNTILCVAIISIYFAAVSLKINKQDKIRTSLEKSLLETNSDLNQYKNAIDKSSIVVITDINGVITYANDKFYKTTGYSLEEVIGNTNSILNSGYHSERFFENLWSVISKGKVWVGGVKNKTKLGKFYWVHLVIIPLTDYKNNIKNFLSIQQDITSHKRLSSQYKDVINRNKELEQFTYIASHDLQEPIKSISGIANLLKIQESYKDEGFVRESLNYIIDSSKRMKELIRGLLDYSLIGRSHELELVNVNEIVDTVLKDLRSIIKNNKAQITFSSLPTMYAYKIELYSLFLNLISNAIKFRKKEIDPIIEVNVVSDYDDYIFSIKDNGIGIDENHSKSIFALFKRLNKRNEYEGSGMGLAHCEKIVELHGGTIWVESEKGKGSTFKFTIPIIQN